MTTYDVFKQIVIGEAVKVEGPLGQVKAETAEDAIKAAKKAGFIAPIVWPEGSESYYTLMRGKEKQ